LNLKILKTFPKIIYYFVILNNFTDKINKKNKNTITNSTFEQLNENYQKFNNEVNSFKDLSKSNNSTSKFNFFETNLIEYSFDVSLLFYEILIDYKKNNSIHSDFSKKLSVFIHDINQTITTFFDQKICFDNLLFFSYYFSNHFIFLFSQLRIWVDTYKKIKIFHSNDLNSSFNSLISNLKLLFSKFIDDLKEFFKIFSFDNSPVSYIFDNFDNFDFKNIVLNVDQKVSNSFKSVFSKFNGSVSDFLFDLNNFSL
jgi:hypothetical protein